MDHVKLQKQNHFCQAWQSALAQHEGEERITSRVTPRVGRDSAGTGWQQLKMQVLSDFTERGGYEMGFGIFFSSFFLTQIQG